MQSRTLPAMIKLHGTAVELGGHALLLRGPSGSGKSDLALRLIDGGARLIADDLVALSRHGDRVMALFPPDAPAHLAGALEVRGLGIVTLAHVLQAPLALVADLVGAAEIERFPEPAFAILAGCSLPVFKLAPFEASAPARLRLALATLARQAIPALRGVGERVP